MEILVTDPASGGEIKMYAEQQEDLEHTTWNIDYPAYGSFLVVKIDGVWSSPDAKDLDDELISEIGNALHPLTRYNSLT